jgi:hypothetical protein
LLGQLLKNKTHGFYIEIGAFDGIYFSNSYFLRNMDGREYAFKPIDFKQWENIPAGLPQSDQVDIDAVRDLTNGETIQFAAGHHRYGDWILNYTITTTKSQAFKMSKG